MGQFHSISSSKKRVIKNDSRNDCSFELLFAKNVPHINEKIFFSLDYASFKNCQEVCNTWNEVLTSLPFQKKAKSLYFSKMLQEKYNLLTPQMEKEINEKDLMVSSGEGIAWRVRTLLLRGVDPNSKSYVPDYHFGIKRQMTPICWAAYKGKPEVMKILLEAGANPDAADGNQNFPLHWAATRGFKSIAKLLIDSGADLDKTDKHGQTPLYWAARIGHTDIVRILLNAGADLNKRNIWGESPLDGPVSIGDMDVALLLINAGAKPKVGINCRVI